MKPTTAKEPKAKAENRIQGTGRDDVLTGTGDNDRINAGDGDDIVTGGKGDDKIFGNDGFDIAVFSGSVYDYAFFFERGNTVLVFGDDGLDETKHIEMFRFDDYDYYIDGRNNATYTRGETLSTDEDTGFNVSTLLDNDFDIDGDAFAISSVTASGSGSMVTLQADGTVSYDPGGAYEYLAVGEQATDTFTYTVTDTQGGTRTQEVTVLVAGVNDTPVLFADADDLAGAVVEDEATPLLSAAGTFPFDDLDLTDSHTVSATPQGSNYLGSLVAFIGTQATGTTAGEVAWHFEIDNSVTQFLAAGETRTQSYDLTVDDGNGGTATETVTVTITGQNDAPTITAATASALLVEDVDSSATGTIAFADVDLRDGHLLSIARLDGEPIGVFSAMMTDVSTGDGAGEIEWNFAIDPAKIQNLAAGDTREQTFRVSIDDGEGGTASQDVTITIEGTNDAPVVAKSLSVRVNEQDAIFDIELLEGASDVDDGAKLRASLESATASIPGVSIEGDKIVFDPDAYDDLNDGDLETIEITYQITDDEGGFVTQNLTIEVEGYTDAPLISATVSNAGAANLVYLNVLTEPARGEEVGITFGGLPAGAKVFDASYRDVTSGVRDADPLEVFLLALPLGTSLDGITLTSSGYEADGSLIASRDITVDIDIDGSTSSNSINFSVENQDLSGSGADTIQFQLDEYIPFVGGSRETFTLISSSASEGALEVDGKDLVYRPGDSFSDLATGESRSATITWTIENDRTGDRSTETVEVEVTGGTFGLVYEPSAGEFADGKLFIDTLMNADLLQTPYDTGRISIIDLSVDAQELLKDAKAYFDGLVADAQRNVNLTEVELNQKKQELTKAVEKADLIGKVILAEAEVLFRDGILFLAREAYEAFRAVADGVEETVDAAQKAVDDAESALRSARRDRDQLRDERDDSATTIFGITVYDPIVLAELGLAEAEVLARKGILELAKVALVAAEAIAEGSQELADAIGDEYESALTKYDEAVQSVSDAYQQLWKAGHFRTGVRTEQIIETEYTTAYETLPATVDAIWSNSQTRAFLYDSGLIGDFRLRNTEDFFDGKTSTFLITDEQLVRFYLPPLLPVLFPDGILGLNIFGNFIEFKVPVVTKTETVIGTRTVFSGRTVDADDALDAGKDVVAIGAEVGLIETKLLGQRGLLEGAELLRDGYLALVDPVEFNLDLELAAQATAQAGLLVEFRIDGGSFDASVDYDITTDAAYNKTTDVLTILPQITNTTTGEDVAFSTASGSIQFFAGILYDFTAALEFLFDIRGGFDGNTLFDISPSSDGIGFTENFAIEGIIPIIDYDSRTSDGFSIGVPAVDNLLPDVFEITFANPYNEVEGTEATPSLSYYDEGDFLSVDVSELTDSLFNLVTAKLELSPELKALLDGQTVDTSSNDFKSAFDDALDIILAILSGEGDTDGDGVVPIFLIDATDETAKALLNFNLIEDDLSTVDPDTLGDFGFYAGFGESDNFFEVSLDVDQIAAWIINRALGNASDVIINPLDLEFGINDVLEIAKVNDKTREKITNFVDINLSAELADFDVSAGFNFGQEFTLSVDEMTFVYTLEDGSIFTENAADATGLTLEDASSYDANGDGSVSYSLSIVPTAFFSNDTEIGLDIGYVLDFIKTEFAAGFDIPLEELFDGEDTSILEAIFSSLEIELFNATLGPLLRIEGDVDLANFDYFEKRFEVPFEPARIEGEIGMVMESVTIA